jgi:hypothetical protein
MVTRLSPECGWQKGWEVSDAKAGCEPFPACSRDEHGARVALMGKPSALEEDAKQLCSDVSCHVVSAFAPVETRSAEDAPGVAGDVLDTECREKFFTLSRDDTSVVRQSDQASG